MTEYIIFGVGVVVIMLTIGGLYITVMMEFAHAAQDSNDEK